VEQFLCRALTQFGDIKTSLGILLGCKDAYIGFVRRRLDSITAKRYLDVLEELHIQYLDSDGEDALTAATEWIVQHTTLVASFIEHPMYKAWRASETANVLSAMNLFSSGDVVAEKIGEPLFLVEDTGTRTDTLRSREPDSYRTSSVFRSRSNSGLSQQIMSRSDSQRERSCRERSSSFDAMASLKLCAIDSVANGSTWLVQLLSVMEDFPVVFTLAKAVSTLGLRETPIVYANRFFESMSNVSRLQVVQLDMDECFVSSLDSEACATLIDGVQSFAPIWRTGFSGEFTPATIVAQHTFSTPGLVVLTLKALYDNNGNIAYVAAFYAPFEMPIDFGKVSFVKRRNLKFMSSWPSVVSESLDDCSLQRFLE
jgi:hypothetical protein